MEYHQQHSLTHPRDALHHIGLACQACQRKKIKCDRTFPCGPCLRSSLQCVPSQRKLRSHHTVKRRVDSELRSRIKKLESLVQSLSGDVTGTNTSPAEEAHDLPKSDAVLPPDFSKYIGCPFWLSLTNEVQGLRDALEDETSDDDADLVSPASSSNDLSSPLEYDLLICPPGSVYVMPGALVEPSPIIAKQLYDCFINNVDPVCKVFHRPTLLAFLENGRPYLGQDRHSPANRALKTATWFVAVTTLRDHECIARFGASRNDLLQLYRRHVEVALIQADLMNTADLATLQAFVIYTVASRIMDASRRAWTMTAIFVRIARAMGLDHEGRTFTPFQTEMRRRLWHQILISDIFASLDRGSGPLISIGSWTTPLPSNVNDDEINEDSTSIPNHETGITDTTYNLMCSHATAVSMRFLTPDAGPRDETWQVRLEAALSLGKVLREKFLQYCDRTQPLHRFLYAAGNSMAAANVLRAVRPLQRHVSSMPPRVDSPFVLQIAVNCLRESEVAHEDPDGQGYRWIFWNQWHALAVALAGLCTIRDTEIAQSAWPYVERNYKRQAHYVADRRHGMLWRPIEKLYRKAKAFRDSIGTPRLDSISPIGSTDTAQGSAFTTPSGLQISSIRAQLPSETLPDFQGGAGYNDSVAEFRESPLLPNGDFSWADWEHIMDDINNTNSGSMPLADTQPLANMQADWSNMMYPDLTQPNGTFIS